MKDNDLKEAMKSIFDAMSKETRKEAHENYLYTFLAENEEWLGDPETMYTMIINKFNNIIEELVTTSLKTDDWIIQRIYTHWNIFDNNITTLCQKLYGSFGCADKGRFILKTYIKYKTTGELPEKFEEGYQTPSSGTPLQWMLFTDGIASLISGNPINYLMMYKELIETKSKIESTENL